MPPVDAIASSVPFIKEDLPTTNCWLYAVTLTKPLLSSEVGAVLHFLQRDAIAQLIYCLLDSKFAASD